MLGDPPSEPRIAGLHLPVAMGLLWLGAMELANAGATYTTVLGAADAIAYGGFTVLVLGTSRMLLAGTTGVDVAGARAWWVPLVLVTAGSLGLWQGSSTDVGEQVFALAWTAGVLLHVAFATVSLLGPGDRPSLAHGWPVALAGAGALAYAVLTALTLPLAALGDLHPLVPLHLLLAGFVVTTIAAVAIEVLPRFTGRALPTPMAGLLAGACIAGPGLLAVGLDGSVAWLRTGAIVEGLALLGLGTSLLFLVTASDRQRASFLLYGVAGIAAWTGALLGAGLGWGLLAPAWIPVHGVVNLLGFVGLVVVGAVIDLYAPALRSGAQALQRHNRAVAGLCVAGVLLFVGSSALSIADGRVGLALYAFGCLIHALGSLGRLA